MKKAVLIITMIIIGAVIIAFLGAAAVTNNSIPSLPSLDEMQTDDSAQPSEMADDISDKQMSASSTVPQSDNPVSPDTPAGRPQSPSATAKTFTITSANYSFAPSVMSVKKGDTVKITLKNTGGFHDLVIDEFGVATKRLNNGEEETVTLVADKTGTFEFYCSVGSHRQMGMKGTLTVIEK